MNHNIMKNDKNYSQNLRKIMSSLEKELSSYDDVSAFIVIHENGFSEYRFFPAKNGIIKIENGEIVIYDKLQHFKGDETKLKKAKDMSVNFAKHLEDLLSHFSTYFSYLSSVFMKNYGYEITDKGKHTQYKKELH